MMNLNPCFTNTTLFNAAQKFFKDELGIQLASPTAAALDKKELIGTDGLLPFVSKLFFIGGISEASFGSGETRNAEQLIADAKYKGMMVFAVEMSKPNPTMTEMAALTRALNRKAHGIPVVVMFRYANFISLATCERSSYAQPWREGEKPGKVSLLKDVTTEGNVHAGHERILLKLSLKDLLFPDYTMAYERWKEVFSVQLLNKDFYKEVFHWYLWAKRHIEIPPVPKGETQDKETLTSIFTIRLLTRLLFVWFIKEKRLVPEELFQTASLEKLLKDFDPRSKKESKFYKAVLQNLFFATLNTAMDKDAKTDDERRQFIDPKRKSSEANEQYLDQTKYRYKEIFKSETDALQAFSTVPFLNGGLFECLDQRENNIEKRYDGFTTGKNHPHVPEFLFFGTEHEEDFTGELSDGKKQKQIKEKVRGLLSIFRGYKFTITENTPLEEEIALDPELLGKVFENLLASYNPETKTTARKQTGSFYTPREIVNYMVDESLKASLLQKLNEADVTKSAEELLIKLFDYTNRENPFDKNTTEKLVYAISHLRILDPACGSGAFPMGILHRMVHLLGKLDPQNKIWKQTQIDKAKRKAEGAFEMDNSAERELRLHDINRVFDENVNNPDYARKLYLIENCIFGVDIQNIAIQISKLRFFISLVSEQKVDDNKENRNILSLPNLETKFVAANTLIALDKPKAQMSLMAMNDGVKTAEENLNRIRTRIFYTRKYRQKKALQKQEREAREKLKTELLKANFSKTVAEQVSNWNPFDQMHPAPFFDRETMFGFEEGFDVVIGNPPYVEHKKLKHISTQLKDIYSTYSGTADLYVYFYEHGIINLKQNGTLVFITSNKFIKTSYGENLRGYFVQQNINTIIDFTDIHVFEALVASCVFSVSKRRSNNNQIKIASANDTLLHFNDVDEFVAYNKFYLAQNNLSESIWQLEDETMLKLKAKIETNSTTINNTGTISVYRGVTTGYNPAFIIGEQEKKDFIKEDKINKEIIKPMLQGRNIKKWIYEKTADYIIFTRRGIDIRKYPVIKKHLSGFREKLEPGTGRKPGSYNWYEIQDNTAYYPEFEREKIIWGLTADRWTFAYDNDGNYLPSNGYILTSDEIPIKFLLALMNSRLMEFYFRFIGIMTAGNAFTLKYETVVEFPIKIVSKSIQNHFISLVDKILTAKAEDKDTSKLERQIDIMVYHLYNLTLPEAQVIDATVTKEEWEKWGVK